MQILAKNPNHYFSSKEKNFLSLKGQYVLSIWRNNILKPYCLQFKTPQKDKLK